jgi:hypothetical protein
MRWLTVEPGMPWLNTSRRWPQVLLIESEEVDCPLGHMLAKAAEEYVHRGRLPREVLPFPTANEDPRTVRRDRRDRVADAAIDAMELGVSRPAGRGAEERITISCHHGPLPQGSPPPASAPSPHPDTRTWGLGGFQKATSSILCC